MPMGVAVDRARVLWAAALAALCGCPGPEEAQESRCGDTQGSVVRALDGDTVELADGRRVRYLLVDTPEIAHNSTEVADCFGDEAKAFNTSYVEGEDVRLEYDQECEDHFGRLLAYVWLGDTMMNELLLERGYARVLSIAPNDKYLERFEALEAEAQDAGAGLWGACP